ncbi:MAG: type II toxin-antitoxin system VapC family toxin [Fibromonadaceae bacterium]|jgi:tRNA(fMet)-specific endonuclease VapC|nr:type II toxin-antitoxin system VapC family toxin [Fibromonadaceae bacterium]
MTYFLDTNTCIYFLKNRSLAFLEKFSSVNASDIKIPAIVVAELYYGAFKSIKKDENISKISKFIALYDVVSFDKKSAKFYGEIRKQLESIGNVIGGNDLLIASIALANNGILVTHNTKEFNRVENLVVEDWLDSP